MLAEASKERVYVTPFTKGTPVWKIWTFQVSVAPLVTRYDSDPPVAERALLEADTSRKRRAEVIDHVAAGFILQGALDRLAHIRREGMRDDG